MRKGFPLALGLGLALASPVVRADLEVGASAQLDMDAGGQIEIDGNWDDSAGTFQPTGGTVVFSGTSTQTITTGATNRFFNLTVSGGTASTAQTPVGAANRLEVRGALSVSGVRTLRINSGDTLVLSRIGGGFPPQKHTISGDGILDLVSGTAALPVTTVQLGDFQQLEVGGTATLRTVAGAEGYSFADRYVLFTRAGASGGYSIHTLGTVNLEFVKFNYLYGRSNAVSPGGDEYTQANVQSAFALSGGGVKMTRFARLWFDQCVDPGAAPNGRFPRYLYLLGDTDNNGVTDASYNGYGSPNFFGKLRFDNAAALAEQSNCEKRAPLDTVTMENGAGALGGTTEGPKKEMDGWNPPAGPQDPFDRGVGDTGVDDINWSSNPTAVDLADLLATGYDGSVVVEWRTAQEVDNLGFNVYRSRFPDAGWIQVNTGLILGMGDSQTGGRYYFWDKTVTNGIRYYYQVEDVDIRGERTLHGPVHAVPEAGLGQPILNDADYVNHGSTEDSLDTLPLASPFDAPDGTGGANASLLEKLLGIDLAAAGIRLLSYDETGALIEVLPPNPSIVAEEREGRREARITMPAYSSTRVLGTPEVPTKRVLLVTPWIQRAQVRVLEAESRSLGPLRVVRSPPPAILPTSGPTAAVRAASSGGGSSPRQAERQRPVTVLEMIEEARRELAAMVAARREELLEARRKGRMHLLGIEERAKPPAGGAGGGGSGAPNAGGGAGESSGSVRNDAVTPGRLFPGELAALGRLLVYGGRQLLPIDLNPVQVQGAGERVDVYRRMLVRIDFIGRLVRPELEYLQEMFRLAADGLALKIHVREDGLYQLGRAELAALGFDVTADPRTFRLFQLGREVAIRVEGEIDGVFGAGDRVLFFGERNPWRTADNREATRHTDDNVYWLTAGGGYGRRMEEVWVRPVAEAVPAVDREAVLHMEENRSFYPRLESGEGRDHWFFPDTFFNTAGGNRTTATLARTLDLPLLSARPHGARLTVALAGVTDFAPIEDHKVVVRLNGDVLGEAVWGGREAFVASFDFPSTLLAAGANELELRLPCDLPGVPSDYVFLNYLRLAHRERFVAESDEIGFLGETPGEYELSGFLSERVLGLETSDPAAPRFLRGTMVDAGVVRMNDLAGGAGSRYYFAGEGAVLAPSLVERNGPSAWNDPSASADWIAIAHPSLREGVEPLADFRRSQGLSTAVADVTDIYDEFTGGIPDPVAIRNFLAHARASWQPGSARFALLVGDGSFDPHGYRWPGTDFIPAPMVQMRHLWAASDNWYAAVEGEDDLPDLALGRLPVRTREALAAAIDKILRHEESPPADWRRRVSLAADNDDAVFDFSVSTGLFADVFGPAYEVEEIYLGERGTAGTRAAVRDAFDQGRLLVGWMGHGSATQWANENVFSAADVPLLGASDRQGLVTAMGCM
ncbi:MAG: hypothetical protein HY720_12785, partial [Planctomycetes bacterium]|nr:hypothetical protein [Planctomycetota bacterium]